MNHKNFFHQSVGHERFISPGWTMCVAESRKFPLFFLFQPNLGRAMFEMIFELWSSISEVYDSSGVRVHWCRPRRCTCGVCVSGKHRFLVLRTNKLKKDRFRLEIVFPSDLHVLFGCLVIFCWSRQLFGRASQLSRRVSRSTLMIMKGILPETAEFTF